MVVVDVFYGVGDVASVVCDCGSGGVQYFICPVFTEKSAAPSGRPVECGEGPCRNSNPGQGI